MTQTEKIDTAEAMKKLLQATYIDIITFRKNGTPVSTPVWFAEADSMLYIETGAESGKVKRIRHTPRVQVAVCNASGKIMGPLLEGNAQFVTNVEELYKARAALHRKYSWKRQLLYGTMETVRILRRRSPSENAYIAIALNANNVK